MMNLNTVEQGEKERTACAKYWYKISKFTFSKRALFNLGVGLFSYLFDLLTDVILIVSYAQQGRVKECMIIVFLIIASGVFTSVYYIVNENWIDDEHELLKPTNKHREFWKKLRFVSQSCLLTPIFRFFFSWKELKLKKHFVKAQYYNRIPINTEEVNSVVRLSENNIVQCSFPLIECFTEGLPQAILQIYLACVSDPAQFGLDTCIGRLQIGAVKVIWPVISASYISTRYRQAYYNHLYTLYYKDYMDYGFPFELANFTKVNFFLSFLANLFVIGVRIFGIIYILVQHGATICSAFIIILFFVQLVWLEWYPDSRVKYENPPRGETNLWSNTIDRLANIYTFHNIYPNVQNMIVYQGLFLSVFCISEYLLSPITRYDILSLEVTSTALGNSTTLTLQFNCFSYLDLFQDRSLMLVLILISLMLAIIYTVSLRVSGAFVKDRMPLAKVHRFAKEILAKDILLDRQIRRYLCLCVTASSSDFSKLLHVFPFSCEFERSRCILKLETLWSKEVSQLPFNKLDRREILDNWISYRNSTCGSGTNMFYLDKLTKSMEGNISEVDLDDDLRFLKICTSFNSYAISMSSHRLGKISTIIQLVGNKECCKDCNCAGFNWFYCKIRKWIASLMLPPRMPDENIELTKLNFNFS